MEGAYRMHDGSEQRDRCTQVWVVAEKEKIPALKEVVRRAGALLGQERMYFESMGGRVEFLEPWPRKDDDDETHPNKTR